VRGYHDQFGGKDPPTAKGDRVSLLSRISGVLDSFQKIELEPKDRYGAGGEDEVERVIHGDLWRYVRNPLAPHPSKPGVYLESDFLVHTGNSLVALEVKKLIGRIVLDDDEHRFIRQEKVGRYGEGVFTKRFSNPLQKANGFAPRKTHTRGSCVSWTTS
jgi:hypothetical protein